MTKPFYFGWDDICELIRAQSKRTARRRIKKFGIPVKYLGKHPTITLEAFNEWWAKVPDSERDAFSPSSVPVVSR